MSQQTPPKKKLWMAWYCKKKKIIIILWHITDYEVIVNITLSLQWYDDFSWRTYNSYISFCNAAKIIVSHWLKNSLCAKFHSNILSIVSAEIFKSVMTIEANQK
jgi:hypothetical protein